MGNLASLALLHDVYTGQDGLYLSAIPDDVSMHKLVYLCREIGIYIKDPSKFHCTLMYSPKHAIPTDIIHGMCLSCSGLNAKISNIAYWIGHDNRNYIVACLDSTELQSRHKQLLNAGAKHTYSDYRPHITLYVQEGSIQYKMKRSIEDINTKLCNLPVTVNMMTNLPNNLFE